MNMKMNFNDKRENLKLGGVNEISDSSSFNPPFTGF